MKHAGLRHLCLASALVLGLPLLAHAVPPAPLSVQDIVQLQKDGLGDEVIKARVKEAGISFAPTSEALANLRDAGVPLNVVWFIARDLHTPGTSRNASSPSLNAEYRTEDGEGHSHEGFYLAMDLGGSTGDIKGSANASSPGFKFSGTGAQFDLRIGWAVATNFLVSLDASDMVISNPTFTVDGTSGALGTNNTVSRTLRGIGFTYYFMPANAFVGVTLGQGSFGLSVNDVDTTSDKAFAYAARIGKEWWVSPRWGLGLVAQVNHLSANQNASSLTGGTVTTTQFSLGFSATFN